MNFSNSLHGRREILSMFVFFMLFFGIALILASKKEKTSYWRARGDAGPFVLKKRGKEKEKNEEHFFF